MLTPKFKEFAAVFQWGAVALFAKYARKGRLEDWERFCKKNKEALPDWNKVDIDAIVDEIEDYLLKSLPKDEREPYLLDVITAFKHWVRDKNSLGEKIIYQDDYVGVWATLFYVFVTKFYAMLLKHGIDMMRLQEECDVYLQNEVNEGVTKLYIGSSRLTKKYIDAIQAKREPQQEEKPILIDDTVILMKVFTEWNGEIWVNIDVLDFVAMMRTGDLVKLEIKQRTKMRKILAGIRMEITDKEKSNRWCENVMKSTDINAKKATPTVTDDEKINSSEMKKFALTLSKIFPQKAK